MQFCTERTSAQPLSWDRRQGELWRHLPSDTGTAGLAGGPSTAPKGAASGARRRPQPWWLVFLVILFANYLAMQFFFPEPTAITIPYTFFKSQIEAGNVADVTSVGEVD